MRFAGTALSSNGEVVTHSYVWDVPRTAATITVIVVLVLLARWFRQRTRKR